MFDNIEIIDTQMIAEDLIVDWKWIAICALGLIVFVLIVRLVALQDEVELLKLSSDEDVVKSIVLEIFDDLYDFRQRQESVLS